MSEKRVTIYDIAEIAGVSVGTVNRALSNKMRISPETKKLVLDTAEKLGYKANAAAQGLRRTPITIGAVLFCPIEEYVDSIISGMESSASDLEKYNVTVDLRKLDYTNSRDCLAKTCELIRGFAEKGYNGIILYMSSMIDEMDELSALIEKLTEKNIFFATVANDIPTSKRVLHVGVNAFMAGKMAAEVLELSCAGKDVALLVTSTDSTVNIDYINGFRAYSGDDAFSSIRIYGHYDDKERVIEETKRLLSDNPALRGVYMATASSAIACECIKEAGRSDLTVITTDLLKKTPELLHKRIANAAIFQNPHRQGRSVVKLLYNYITGRTDAGVHLVAPHILLSSNLENYLHEGGLQ